MTVVCKQEQLEDRALGAPRRMLNEKQVRAIVPIGHATLWRLEKAGRFPKSTFISPNRRIWFADEIAAWQNEIDGQDRRTAKHKP